MSEIAYLGTFFCCAILSIALSVSILFIAIAFFNKIEGTKSQNYRELLVDMYVVGTIKKLAKKDDLDLVKELHDFNKVEKKSKLSEKGLSYVIEEELKEKIAKVQEEKITKV